MSDGPMVFLEFGSGGYVLDLMAPSFRDPRNPELVIGI